MNKQEKTAEQIALEAVETNVDVVKLALTMCLVGNIKIGSCHKCPLFWECFSEEDTKQSAKRCTEKFIKRAKQTIVDARVGDELASAFLKLAGASHLFEKGASDGKN